MKLAEAFAFGKRRAPIPSMLFLPRREFQELYHDIRLNHRYLVKDQDWAKPIACFKVDHLKIFNASTDQQDIVNEANQLASEEYMETFKQFYPNHQAMLP